MAILSKEELFRRAPADIQHETIEVPEWLDEAERDRLESGHEVDIPEVKVRSLTSGQLAAINKICVRMSDGNVDMDIPELQVRQVCDGLVEPQLTIKEVRRLQGKSGAGFQRILNWINDASGFDEEKAKDALARFRTAADGPDETAAEDDAGPEVGENPS